MPLKGRRPVAEGGGQPASRKEKVYSGLLAHGVHRPNRLRRFGKRLPLQRKKKRLRMADGSEPSYVAKANAEERARGKKPCSGTEVVAGLGEIDEKRLQEYESSLLDIPTDEEKDYYLGLGYDEAFRKMMMTWGVVSISYLYFSFIFLSSLDYLSVLF